MKYCNACNIILNAALASAAAGDSTSTSATGDGVALSATGDDVALSAASDDVALSSDGGAPPRAVPASLQEIQEALSALVRARDPNQSALISVGKSVNLLYFISLNSNIIIFIYIANKQYKVHQAVNFVGTSARTKKFFRRPGLPNIYWW
jgi:hypothetical protein